MTYNIYILYSAKLDQYYIGHTENISDSIFRHNNSSSQSTKKANDWVLKYTEAFGTRGEAMKRALEIKNKKSRKYIVWLINTVVTVTEVVFQ